MSIRFFPPSLPVTFCLACLLCASSLAADTTNLKLVSQNLNRFFDDKDDGNKEKVVSTKLYQKRLRKLVDKIANTYAFADVLAFQEIENIDILQAVRERLENKHQQHYQPVLIEGNDKSGIDVAFLVKKPWQVIKQQNLFQHATFNSPPQKLFSRPPLQIEICADHCVTVINLHLRSMRGLRSHNKGKRVALKRRLQAESIANWVQRFQQAYSDKALILVGDFNALTPSDAHVDVVGTIIGKPDQRRPRWTSPDLVSRDLIDSSLRVSSKSRYSYLYKKKKQQLDYLLMSQNLQHQLQSLHFSRIDYSFSDHAALKAEFRLGQHGPELPLFNSM